MYYLAYSNIQQPWILIFFQALMDTSDLSDVTAENLSDDDDNYDENYMSCITRIGDETTRCVLNFSFDLNTKRVFNASLVIFTTTLIRTLYA